MKQDTDSNIMHMERYMSVSMTVHICIVGVNQPCYLSWTFSEAGGYFSMRRESLSSGEHRQAALWGGLCVTCVSPLKLSVLRFGAAGHLGFQPTFDVAGRAGT